MTRATGLTVSIDPGLHGCGVAVFLDGLLAHAEYTGGLGGQIHTLLEPIEPVERLLFEVAGEGTWDRTTAPIHTLIVEVPQVYDTPKQKGRQVDVLRLYGVAIAIVAVARPFVRAALTLQPAEWKGQVPKDVMVERIKGRLSPDEMDVIDLPSSTVEHNLWDAVGIGLRHAGRL